KQTLAPGVNVTCLKYDANTFKSQVNDAILTPTGIDGTLTIFRDSDHRIIADQLCSEDYTPGRKGEHTYNVWKMKKPQVADNDLWDALVGTAALASFVGVESASASIPKPVKKKRPVKKFSELLK
ncbi:MAG: hypothetical protein FWD31_14065, partial [Planctomycetaceae bacterium]|nr:hypothetical protein [Planctomycetaceae bacterium]